MKHTKRHFSKNNKDDIKKGLTVIIFLFFAMVMIFPKQNTTTEITFVRNSNDTMTHNAAQDRSYLFENEQSQGQSNTGSITGNIVQNFTGNTTGDNITGIDNLVDPKEIDEVIRETNTGELFTGNINTGTQSIQNTGNITTGNTDCTTPWGTKIKNKDFVLAYQQRKDVNSICNIEKRICSNGILGGSFTQNSCKEDVVYEYRKAEVISYNQKVLNEYIQTAPPINSGAEFSNEGKINNTEKATDTRGTTKNTITTKQGIIQTPLSTKKNCTSPRGQTIQHGQFIKAYKTPRGFIDLACEVELRPCIDGNLKGNFNYQKCTFNNITYTEYLNAGSPMSNTGFLFFEWIKAKFKFRK